MKRSRSAPAPITIWGGHLDEPPEFAMPVIRAYGLAVMNWGRLEQHLDMVLISINKEEFTADPALTPNTSFRLKVDLFKSWFVKDSRLAAYHTPAKRLATALLRANGDRQLLVHCNLQRFEEGPPAKMVATQITHKKGETYLQRSEWTETQLLRFSNAVHRLNTGLRTISSQAITFDFLRFLESTRPQP